MKPSSYRDQLELTKSSHNAVVIQSRLWMVTIAGAFTI